MKEEKKIQTVQGLVFASLSSSGRFRSIWLCWLMELVDATSEVLSDTSVPCVSLSLSLSWPTEYPRDIMSPFSDRLGKEDFFSLSPSFPILDRSGTAENRQVYVVFHDVNLPRLETRTRTSMVCL